MNQTMNEKRFLKKHKIIKYKSLPVSNVFYQPRLGVVVYMSRNGWMNTELTLNWLTYVWGSLAFRRRLLAWDAYRCHITDEAKEKLKRFKTDMAVIPPAVPGLSRYSGLKYKI